jgi:hypothetical protein
VSFQHVKVKWAGKDLFVKVETVVDSTMVAMGELEDVPIRLEIIRRKDDSRFWRASTPYPDALDPMDGSDHRITMYGENPQEALDGIALTIRRLREWADGLERA